MFDSNDSDLAVRLLRGREKLYGQQGDKKIKFSLNWFKLLSESQINVSLFVFSLKKCSTMFADAKLG